MTWNHKIHCLWFSLLYQHSKLAIVNDYLWRWSYVLLQNLSLPVSMGRKSHQVYSFIQFFLLCRYWINSWKWTVQYITLILVIIGWPCRMYRLWCITLHISLQFVAWNFYSSHLSIFLFYLLNWWIGSYVVSDAYCVMKQMVFRNPASDTWFWSQDCSKTTEQTWFAAKFT